MQDMSEFIKQGGELVDKREWVLSVDVGTSSVKATIFNGAAELVAEASSSYPLISTQLGYAELNPHTVIEAFHEAISKVLTKTSHCPKVMVLSTAMHALLAVDDAHQPTTNLVTWADQRAERQAEELRSSDLGNYLYQRTGTPIHAMSPLVKLAWFRDNKPEIFEKARLWADLKAWILFDLLKEWLIDESLASATGLYNLSTRDWDEEALEWCGLSSERLPKLVKTTDILGQVRTELADRLGFTEPIQVVAGASDGALANLGVGAVGAGCLAISIGTSGAVRGMVHEPKLDPEGRLFCYHVAENYYIVGGPINNGGILLRWLQGILSDSKVPMGELTSESVLAKAFYEQLNRGVVKIPAGSDGLFCLPYLTGERAPLWREDVSGSFWGLRLTHSREHFMRAVLEGVCYQLNSVVELLVNLVGPISEIRATGGFTKSEVWLQILTDVLGQPIGVPAHAQGSALGGACIAWLALGQLHSLENCADLVPIARVYQVESSSEARYQEGCALFKELVNLGEKIFPRLQEFAQKGASS